MIIASSEQLESKEMRCKVEPTEIWAVISTLVLGSCEGKTWPKKIPNQVQDI